MRDHARRTRLSLAGAIAGAIAIAVSSPAVADTIPVPGGAPSIQAAISLALPGDTVLVAPGTWFENLDFLGKPIAVRSSGGPAVTIIDGGRLDSVVTFQSGEGADALLEGFTIRGGLPDLAAPGTPGGGGVRCIAASPTIRGNVIRENSALWYGGGILCTDSFAVIEGNEIIANDFECLLADFPCSSGGGIAILGGAPQVIGNRIAGNIASGDGGGIYCFGTTGALIAANRIEGNGAFHGGGIAIASAEAELVNLLVVGNQAFGFLSLTGLIPGDGGGIRIAGGAMAAAMNSTIAVNDASGAGGGVSSEGQSFPLVSSIVWGNTAVGAAQLSGTIDAIACDVEGGAPGPGNIDADPLFVIGPAGGYYLSQIAAGQGVDSPCLDLGITLPGTIVEGTTRTDEEPDLGTIDLGFHHSVSIEELRRGDVGGDGATNIADAVFLLAALFPPAGGPASSLRCEDAADTNDDGALTIADAISLLAVLFLPGTPPLPPPTDCGADPTPDPLDCGLHPPCAIP